jgi:hypothetical protein
MKIYFKVYYLKVYLFSDSFLNEDRNEYYAIFSKNGFTEELLKYQKEENIFLVCR